jgi:phosphotransferase system enzyme I (PtsI)
VFEAMDDPYLRSRKEDVDQVINRVISALQRQTSPEERKLAARVGEILIADSIAPADMAQLAGNGLLGVVGSSGSPYSHSAILARSLGLPMLVGTRDALSNIHDDDLILLDAERGEAVVHPTAQDLSRYRAWQREAAIEGRRLAMLANAPTRTRDGVDDRLLANAETATDVAMRARAAPMASACIAPNSCSCGTRACRRKTSSSSPIATWSWAWAACRSPSAHSISAPTRPMPPGLDHARRRQSRTRRARRAPVAALPGGVHHPDPRDSARRLLRPGARAGADGDAAGRTDRRAHAVQAGAAGSQAREHRPAGKLPLGAMIEVPAAAINVRALLEHADFLAIGTNDLAQYVLAADRGNDALENIYNPVAAGAAAAAVARHQRRPPREESR